MAVVHDTTLKPTKLELLTSWLPTQPWYVGAGGAPELSKAGGFRLDDPDGEVGLEFMAVTDASGDRPVTYHVPLSYRGAPLEGGERALVGNTEHGVLGRRWIYDGIHDPVMRAQLLALITGNAEAQDQNASDAVDPSVTASFSASGTAANVSGGPAAITLLDVVNGPRGTDALVAVDATRQLTLTLHRVLQPQPEGGPTSSGPAELGHVSTVWRLADGTTARGRFATVHDGAPARTTA
ncbi:1,4-alpha-glucan branching protein [Streptomyces endophytica]|uniref:1,4-alpha-glucan branching protein n=2 Tax=Streptomyces endophytica TaxID=2991496 RepID=A0ABY6PLG3_9ACTN|nr:1,4-alpha-glucan branching protein [Streptomyces endophytica]UZJ34162.1 1,4-alpha-glucan branching protein [Streptomyces endophytica]